MNPTPLELQQIYRIRFSPEAQRKKDVIWETLVTSFFQKWVGASDTVLDLGCGYGEFLNHVKCSRRIGVDLNPDSPTRLHKGIEFHQHSVCELPFIEDGSVNLVFTSNLMEHLPGKPAVEEMIREAYRVLKPSGSFVMMGPNMRHLPGTYWDFWDHVVAITDRSLVEALVNNRFDIAECYDKFLPYTTRSSLPKGPALVRAYLAFRPMWRIMGKQFLIRAVRPK